MQSDDKDNLLEENTSVRDAIKIPQSQVKAFECPDKFPRGLHIIVFQDHFAHISNVQKHKGVLIKMSKSRQHS